MMFQEDEGSASHCKRTSGCKSSTDTGGEKKPPEGGREKGGLLMGTHEGRSVASVEKRGDKEGVLLH